MTQIITYSQLLQLRNSIHFHGKTLVLVSGVFDLLHQEHRRLLKKAKPHGDILIVGVETDDRARQLKGKGRPVNPFVHRLEALKRLDLADYIFALPDNFGHSKVREDFVLNLRPHILAVSENTPSLGEKRRVMKLVEGEVRIVHQYNPHISTTKLLDKLRKPAKL